MAIKLKKLEVEYIKKLQNEIYEMGFIGDDFSGIKFGQFINLKINDAYLRRPISIMDVNDKQLKITFKVVGNGTRTLSNLSAGSEVDVLYPLGIGYHLPKSNEKNILIVAGGIGTPPLVGWYKYLKKENKYNIKVILGFKDESFEIYNEIFDNLEISYDYKDKNIIEYMKEKDYFEKFKDYYIYSCGAMPMLEFLAKNFDKGQMLLEERMGCGFGACMGCSRKISESEYKRVCMEGPMFYNKEVSYGFDN